MCGIAGAFGGGRIETLEAAVRRMTAAQRHRGPDERRVVRVGGRVPRVLGFDRLAILDLSADASQPMHHASTGSWLVFNGEIYNFGELRADLERRGHAFRSRGDAEVLLGALVEWGAAALTRLRGMYAFAFFDGRTERLLVARDPFGIKPLVYGWQGGTFLFASELRALRAAALAPATLDGEAVAAYLRYGAVPEPATVLREVRVLPPGHVLELDARGGLRGPRRVHGLADWLGEPASPRSAVDEVADALGGAVASHLVSDVPLGVLLSGGVDSTLVASLAARQGGEPQFLTVGFDEPGFNEVATARATALRLGGRHHVIPLAAEDVLALLPDALAAMDQPTADGVNTFVIARAAAARGIKVLVSGLGGDELFGGYTTFRKAPLLAARARWLAPLGRALAALGVGNGPQWRKLASAGAVRALREAYLVQRAVGAECTVDARCGLPPAAWEALAPPAGVSDFHAVSYLELAFYCRNQLLRDADVFSSANAVELRVPFLDLDVLRAAWRIPADRHLGRAGGRKRVLRDVLARLEPAHPIRRAKMGFVFPWRAWLHGALGARVADALGDGAAHEAVGLDPADGVRLRDALRRDDPRVGWAEVWTRFVLLEWQRRVAAEDAAPSTAPRAVG